MGRKYFPVNLAGLIKPILGSVGTGQNQQRIEVVH